MCSVLWVWWMTSCLHIVGHAARGYNRDVTHQGSEPGAKPAIALLVYMIDLDRSRRYYAVL